MTSNIAHCRRASPLVEHVADLNRRCRAAEPSAICSWVRQAKRRLEDLLGRDRPGGGQFGDAAFRSLVPDHRWISALSSMASEAIAGRVTYHGDPVGQAASRRQ